jgi:hypothetical protein
MKKTLLKIIIGAALTLGLGLGVTTINGQDLSDPPMGGFKPTEPVVYTDI